MVAVSAVYRNVGRGPVFLYVTSKIAAAWKTGILSLPLIIQFLSIHVRGSLYESAATANINIKHSACPFSDLHALPGSAPNGSTKCFHTVI